MTSIYAKRQLYTLTSIILCMHGIDHTRWPVCMYLEIDASTVMCVVVHRQSICLLKVQIRKVHNACLCTCGCVKLTVREILQCTCFNNFQNNWFNVCLGKFVFIRSGNIKIIWTRMDFCDALVSITLTMIKSIYIHALFRAFMIFCP